MQRDGLYSAETRQKQSELRPGNEAERVLPQVEMRYCCQVNHR